MKTNYPLILALTAVPSISSAIDAGNLPLTTKAMLDLDKASSEEEQIKPLQPLKVWAKKAGGAPELVEDRNGIIKVDDTALTEDQKAQLENKNNKIKQKNQEQKAINEAHQAEANKLREKNKNISITPSVQGDTDNPNPAVEVTYRYPFYIKTYTKTAEVSSYFQMKTSIKANSSFNTDDEDGLTSQFVKRGGNTMFDLAFSYNWKLLNTNDIAIDLKNEWSNVDTSELNDTDTLEKVDVAVWGSSMGATVGIQEKVYFGYRIKYLDVLGAVGDSKFEENINKEVIHNIGVILRTEDLNYKFDRFWGIDGTDNGFNITVTKDFSPI